MIATASQQNTNEISAEKFAAEIGNMINSNEEVNKMLLDDSNTVPVNNEFSTARLIVKSEKNIDTYGASSVINGFDDLWVMQYSSPDKAKSAYEHYINNPDVEFVEVDKKLYALTEEEDASVVTLSESEEKSYLSWGPRYIKLDKLNSKLTENNTPLTDTIVAVIDTGVDPNHPYLKGRVLPTRINTSSSGTRNDSMDDNGHGTQVAGVIVDSTLDNIFVKPYKVLDNRGSGTLISLAAGINCAVNDGVDIINISIGFEEESDVLKSAVDNAELNDILVVGAAGNDGSDTLYYPASYDNVVKVTAINSSGILPSFSTYGNGVDFAAPGISIKTTTLNNGYMTTKGTSFAAPFVASLAATIKAVDNLTSAEDILELMTENAVQANEHNAEIKYGNGILNAPQEPLESGSREKVEKPYFSHETAFSYEEIDVEIFCDTPNAVIYYTTDRTIPSKSNPNAKIYSGEPIHASQTIILMAVAYCEGMYRSSVASFASIIAPYANENELTVNPSGVLTSFSGTATSFTVPETVNGITVTSVGANAFEGTDVTEVILPNTVTTIGESAFKDCENLKTIYGKNVTTVGDYAFQNCIWIKNLFLQAELTSIGKHSFENVGTKQYLFTGSTFKLQLSKISAIPEAAFKGSAISEIDLGTVTIIEKQSFSECEQLVNVHIDNAADIPIGYFRNLPSLTVVEIHGLTFIPASAFNTCESLTSAVFPDATEVAATAFEDCVSLVNLSLPSAVTVRSDSFKGCEKLRTLVLPEVTSINLSYGKKFIELPPNLEWFEAPKLTKTVSDMFKTAPDITYIRLNSATDIASSTFRGCHNIYSLNIEKATHINAETFNDCTITFIDARSLVTTDDMPDNSGILLSNNFIESTATATNLTVYGTPGTFVERYSNLKGYNFIGIPLIYKPVPEYVTENSETVYVIAVGFDLTYQWYWNTSKSSENGNAIEGATTMSYTFTDADTAPYYYCAVTQNDLGTVSTITTNIITKDTTPADYTAYNAAVEKAKTIDRSLYTSLAELDSALEVDVSERYSCEQSFVDTQTKAINDAIANLKVKKVETVELYASETTLGFLDSMRIIPVLNPKDVKVEKTEWISSNEDVIVVTHEGYAWCIGKGTAEVTLRVTNIDGSITEGSIIFEGQLTNFEKIISYLFGFLAVIANKINTFFANL